MPIYAFNFLKDQYKESLKDKKVLLLGVSYRSEVGDTRYTPVETFYNLCLKAGCKMSLHDPYVTFWEETSREVSPNVNELLELKPEIIVISTGHKFYSSELCVNALLTLDSIFLYDTIGVWSKEQIQKLRNKHTVKILGRGDL